MPNKSKAGVIPCAECNELFRQGRANQKTCSQECAQARQRKQCARRRAGISHPDGKKLQCRQCGDLFTPNKGSKICSDKCRSARKHDHPFGYREKLQNPNKEAEPRPVFKTLAEAERRVG